jgi:hypothetical protein
MTQPAAAVIAPDQIVYMDATGTAVGSHYKRRLVAALDVRPGQAAVDIGCGPGTDLRPGGLFGKAEPDWDTLAVADIAEGP